MSSSSSIIIKSIRIGNQVVSELPNNGPSLCSVKRFEKLHKVNVLTIPYVSTGTRLSDEFLMMNLLNSNNPRRFDSLAIVYP